MRRGRDRAFVWLCHNVLKKHFLLLNKFVYNDLGQCSLYIILLSHLNHYTILFTLIIKFFFYAQYVAYFALFLVARKSPATVTFFQGWINIMPGMCNSLLKLNVMESWNNVIMPVTQTQYIFHILKLLYLLIELYLKFKATPYACA